MCISLLKDFPTVHLSPLTELRRVRMRRPAAMAGRLARPSPCDWLQSGVYKPLSRYHIPHLVIGSDGSAHPSIQTLALIFCQWHGCGTGRMRPNSRVSAFVMDTIGSARFAPQKNGKIRSFDGDVFPHHQEDPALLKQHLNLYFRHIMWHEFCSSI